MSHPDDAAARERERDDQAERDMHTEHRRDRLAEVAGGESEMDRAYRQDNAARVAADGMRRQIDLFLAQHRPAPRTRELLERTRDELARTSAQIVRTWD